jgi:N-acetylmuramoyl-L-alanine amidase
MAISGDWIVGIKKQKLKHVGGAQPKPNLLVIHYSVTDTVAQAVTALDAKTLGYHILIEKDGTAYQTRPFIETAAHPGRSNWKKQTKSVSDTSTVQVNSIGICLMNMGFAHGTRPNKKAKLIYNPKDASMDSWEVYPAPQLATCSSIVADIIATYKITEVVGHHDIAVMGKFDPGPLYDFGPDNALLANPPGLGMDSKVKAGGSIKLLEERAAGSKVLDTLNPGETVHIRSVAYGPPAMSLAGVPDTAANRKKRWITRWASVGVGNTNKHAGYVDLKGLTKTPLVAALDAKL